MSYKIEWEVLTLKRPFDEVERLKAAVEGLPVWEWKTVWNFDHEDTFVRFEFHCLMLDLLDRFYPLKKASFENFKTVRRATFEYKLLDANEYMNVAMVLMYGEKRYADGDIPEIPGIGDLAKFFNCFVSYEATDEDGKCTQLIGAPDGKETANEYSEKDDAGRVNLYDFAAMWSPDVKPNGR